MALIYVETLLQLINGVRQRLLIGFHIEPNVAVALMARRDLFLLRAIARGLDGYSRH